MHMEQKSSFPTEKPIDYTESKDAYDGKRETASYKDAASLPPAKRPDQDKADEE